MKSNLVVIPAPSRKSSDTVPSTLLLFGGGGAAKVVDAVGFDVLVFPRLVPVVIVAGVTGVYPTSACAATTAAT